MTEEFPRTTPMRSLVDVGPAAHAITEAEFIARFKAWMLELIGPTFADGDSVAEYADMTGPTYWEDVDQREWGPEECAESDVSEMELEAP